MRKCMTANELLAYNQGYNAGLKAGIDLNIEPMLRQQALEIQALHQILGYEGVAVGQDYLDECVAELRKAQEK